MTNHPNRSVQTTKITAIYRQTADEGTYAAYFEVPRFRTNGVDVFSSEVEATLIDGLVKQLRREATAFHVAAGLDPNGSREVHGKLLAFYTPRRAKALINRYDNPIEF